MQLYDKHELFRCRVNGIVDAHEKRNRELNQEGARLAWLTCPAIALVLSVLSWALFNQGNPGMGVVYAVGALAFLAMLVIAHRRGR